MSATYIYSNQITTPDIVALQGITKPYRYVVYTGSGGNCFAENGWTGNIDYTGSASSVINSALTAANSANGAVLCRAGLYSITSPITVYTGTLLMGEGKWSTIFQLANGANCNVIQTSGNLWLAPNLAYFGINGNSGSNSSGYCIAIANAMHGDLEHIAITQAPSHAIYVTGSAGYNTLSMRYNDVDIENGSKSAIYYDSWAFDACIVNSNFGNNAQHNLVLGSTSQMSCSHSWGSQQCGIVGYAVDRLGIVNCTLEGNGQHGIWLYNSSGSKVIGCNVQNNASITNYNSGIMLDGTTRDTTVIGNVVRDLRTPRLQYGITEATGSNWNTIIGNDTVINVAAMTIYGANTNVHLNNGFITENNTTGPFNVQYTGLKSVTIPHWCNYTPNISDIALTVLQGTPVTDWNYDMLQVTGSDATNLYCMVVVTSGSATSNAYASVGVKVNRCQKG